MSMWSRFKVAVLTATVAATALQFGGCFNVSGLLNWNTILKYVAIGNIFD